jgi:hypothetical protein
MKERIFDNKWVIPSITVILITISYFIFFKKDKIDVINDIYTRSFNDTILNIATLKVLGPATMLKHCDTPLLINGVNDSLQFYFSSYSDAGLKAWEGENVSIFSKKAKSDSFYLYRANQVIVFRLIHKKY